MSDLSQALVDAAAEADWTAHNAAVLKAVGRRGTLDEKRREISRARSRAAVAAVLETLAKRAHWLPVDASSGYVTAVEVNEALTRLATEVKGDA